MRGARGLAATFGAVIGIIPACAGSTETGEVEHRRQRDHPRMCGEHGAAVKLVAHGLGSSPHVRGARGHGHVRFHGQGIIPACAGSTSRLSAVYPTMRDHPRMCGEHPADRLCSGRERGSSPHVRGAPLVALRSDEACGIIPACAGSTNPSRPRWSRRRDHPRMCGEHTSKIA